MICCLLYWEGLLADTYTEQQGKEAWDRLKGEPLTENNFHLVCDLMQDVGATHIGLSYRILAEYLPMVKATGNKTWVHVLLMGWAKAKESTGYFAEADTLYRKARANAAGSPRLYDESLVGTVLMYAEWGNMDSLRKYAEAGEKASAASGDKESLSLIYTFRSIANSSDTAYMRASLQKAMDLAVGLSDKNAWFTARYNYAVICCQSNPQKQVGILESLLALTGDSSLNHRPRLYERTAFSFRNAGPSIYYQLMQVNLLLTDYENAWKFAELFYDATVKPNPAGVMAPYYNAEMAIVKAYQGEYDRAKEFEESSLALFHLPEDKIPYTSYFLAAGMLAEHAGQYEQALHYYEIAYKKGSTEGLHLMSPDLYYAHALILSHHLDLAAAILERLKPDLRTRTWSAFGYYYYKHEAELLKARGDNAGYASALETFYDIKDSLTNLNHYRAIQEIETKMRVREKEGQIARLNEENIVRAQNARRERIYFIVFLSLSLLTVLLLIGYSRNQHLRKQQAERIARQNEELQQNRLEEIRRQHRIDMMQSAIDAEEKERRNIAGQLHDDVGAQLSLAILNLSSALEKGMQDDQSGPKLQKSLEILSSASAVIRDLSHRLTPFVIEKYGLRKAVEDMAYSVNLSGKLRLETVIVGFTSQEKYPVSFLNDVYRILQELLQNILKHAQASHAMIELVEHEGLLSVMVEDNGVGIAEEAGIKGQGLKAIRSKIAYINGRMEITGKKGKGSLIVIELPLGGQSKIV